MLGIEIRILDAQHTYAQPNASGFRTRASRGPPTQTLKGQKH